MACATLAQLVEQCFRKAEVPSSNLGGGSKNLARLCEIFVIPFLRTSTHACVRGGPAKDLLRCVYRQK